MKQPKIKLKCVQNCESDKVWLFKSEFHTLNYK